MKRAWRRDVLSLPCRLVPCMSLVAPRLELGGLCRYTAHLVRFCGSLIGVSRAINPWDASRRWTCYPSSSVCLIDGFPVARQYSTSYFRFSSHVAASLCLSTHDWPSSPLHVTHASSVYTFFHLACAINLSLYRALLLTPCLSPSSRVYAFEHALQHQDLILLLLRRRVGCSCGLLRIGFTSTLTFVDPAG